MQAAETEAARHLERYGLAIGDLPGLAPPVGPSETLLLVGSVPEGLANEESDLDLLLLGESSLTEGLVIAVENTESSTVRLPSQVDLNCEILRPADLDHTAKRFASTFDAIRNPEGAARIVLATEHELRMLHRIRCGVALVNPEVADHWRRALRTELLADYSVLLALSRHLEFREDAIAQAKIGDARTTARMVHLCMDYLAFSLLSSIGETNPNAKWRVRLLERHRGSLDSTVVDRCIDFLFQTPMEDPRGLMKELTAFADSVFEEILTRRPQVLQASAELGRRLIFTTQVT